MVIRGLGTAAPLRAYTQRECWDALQNSDPFQLLDLRARAILKKVLTGQNGIHARHLALADLAEAFDISPDALHARFAKHAPDLASQAARQALEHAATAASEIDAVVVSTCTGYLCPGLTSYVSERLGLRQDVLGLDLVGQGCAAALPNLRTAEAFLHSGRCDRVLSVCVEVCSAAFFLDNDPGVLISACLFGDGAGAAVLSREPGSTRPINWVLSESLLRPDDRDVLRFAQRRGMLRNVLSPQVPALAARHAQAVLENAVKRAEVSVPRITGWLFHPGGRDVLSALGRQLGLSANALRWSASVLHEFGNLSSASLFFVLKAALEDSAPGGYWWMSSFGAGFSCHGALLQVE